MKNRIVIIFLFVIAVFSSCNDKCFYYENEVISTEVLMDLSEIKGSFKITQDYAIGKPGNIYSYDKYLLVAEKFKGIHILDNSTPSNPTPIKFIELKGNENFAVRNNVLLADNGPDLLSIDLSNLNDIKILSRTENINTQNIRGNKFVVGYETSIQKVKRECSNGSRWAREDAMASSTTSSGSNSTGKGGSMSKFAIVNNFLYMVNSSEMIPVDISNPAKPVSKLKMGLASGNVETLFPYNSYLYMGTSDGILVYNTAGSAETPNFISNIRHILGCDPVIVDKDVAFSTVRGGTACRTTNLSQLNIYNVANPSQSYLIRSEPMTEPYGLGIKDDLLFVCQGKNGLFVYQYDQGNLSFKHSYPDIHAFDVIVNGNILIVTADNGLFQFDISDKNNVVYLSKLVNF